MRQSRALLLDQLQPLVFGQHRNAELAAARKVREAVGKESVLIQGLTIKLDSNWGEKEVTEKIMKELREAKRQAARRSLRSSPDMQGAH